MKDWNARATPLLLYREREFEWANGEEMSMFNRFENDSAHISPVWLVQRAVDRGLRVTHLLKITHLSSRVPHFLLVLEKDQYMCDCAMGLNLGVPCRHFFHAWTTFGGLRFQIGLIRRRWYKNPNLDTTEIPAVAFNPVAPITQPSNSALPSVLLANPLHTTSTPGFTPPATQTVGAREVNHEAHAVLRPILESVRTAGDLEDVLEDLRALKRARTDAESEGHVRDPIAPNPTGRPRSARITSRLEGRPRGGGPTRSLTLQSQSQVHSGPHPVVPAPTAGQSEQRRCGRCRQIGHNRTRCPLGP
ncbi:hypothetical protein FA13DRAFT_1733987 [Coprinellus micaceus]|uniref:SWIM-type domain-containing protein n=1 Tax=Coprinellus micaceus TaxID=71717 RepID=A0A4Y7T7T3_COPMI|nr:hypothetical protein FA13DRAFT_1733987 [Coprinellus micaceus]